MRPRHCPRCGSALEWCRIDMDAGSEGERPDEAMAYADCDCGLGLTLNVLPPDPEGDEADPDDDQPDLFTMIERNPS